MTLRRGFKTEAKQLAAEIRSELGLSPIDPLDPKALAEHLAIDILPLSDFMEEAPAVMHFLEEGVGVFSAITIFFDTARFIIHNDRHSEGRQRSNLAHELAHALLQHQPMPLFSDLGLRHFNKDMEDEANWLSGTLLVSEQAALHIARSEIEVNSAAELYGVSTKMLQYRLNVTGAYKRVAAMR